LWSVPENLKLVGVLAFTARLKEVFRIMSQSYLLRLHLRLQTTSEGLRLFFFVDYRKKEASNRRMTLPATPQHWSSSDTLTSVVAMSCLVSTAVLNWRRNSETIDESEGTESCVSR